MARQEFTVTFHGLGSPGRDITADERPFWASAADFEHLVRDVLEVADENGLSPLFTFDDGNMSDLEIAAPVLARHGGRAIFFPCSGRIGKPGYLDGPAIRELTAAGFGIGSHGIDHVPWASLAPAQLQAEVEGSKSDLEEVTGGPIRAAALPFGSYRRRVLAALSRAGYERVYSSDPGLGDPRSWFSPRFSYRNDRAFVPGDLVAQMHSGLPRLTQGAKTLIKGWR